MGKGSGPRWLNDLGLGPLRPAWGYGQGLLLLLGLGLALTLHACQPTPPPMATMPPAAETEPVPEAAPEPVALPAETQALVDGAGGLYQPSRGDIRLVVISDLNGAYGSTDYDPEIDTAMALLPFWQPDMVLCSGDMVAGQDLSLSEAQLQAMWTAFDDHVATPLRRASLPYGFTIGNHDASSARGPSGGFTFEQERAVARNYWNDPAHDPRIEFIDRYDFPFYYSFKFGDAFFVAWDGSSSQIPLDELDWVEKALTSPEAQAAQIKILLGHLPLYAVAEGRNLPGEVMADADQLQAMLERHNVHTYISGHQHAYYPGHKDGLQLLHAGVLGSGPRPYVGETLPSRKSLTVLDIRFDDPELTTYTTYDMEALTLINLEDLPRVIAGHNGTVLRRDVALEDVAR